MALFDFIKKGKKEKAHKAPKRAAKKEPLEKAAETQEAQKEEAPERVALKESRSAWRILREPHVTEKSSDLAGRNQYVFKVLGKPSKPEVKKAVEETHSVHVEKVRKISLPPKQRKRGRHTGWKSGYTKAIITLREGEKIEVLPH